VCCFCPFYRSLCLLSFPRPPRRRYFGPRKLFGRARRLLISWPRLSSSGLVLTRRYSSRRIYRIRIAREMSRTLFREGGQFMRSAMYARQISMFVNKSTLVANRWMRTSYSSAPHSEIPIKSRRFIGTDLSNRGMRF